METVAVTGFLSQTGQRPVLSTEARGLNARASRVFRTFSLAILPALELDLKRLAN
jgi:hypothetical protein